MKQASVKHIYHLWQSYEANAAMSVVFGNVIPAVTDWPKKSFFHTAITQTDDLDMLQTL